MNPLSAGTGEDAYTVPASSDEMTDDEFLDYLQYESFKFFWYEANPDNGLIKDRNTAGSPSSIASIGFGLTAICIGIDRGWITAEEGRQRVLTTLHTLWTAPQGRETAGKIGYKGFFYHFLDMQTGYREWNSELSSIDTALLIAGVLYAKEYFTSDDEDEIEIRNLADSIYQRVEWNWMRNWEPTLRMGWMPETNSFLEHKWIGYNEAMILYILACGSPTYSLPSPDISWNAWTSGYSWQTHYGYSFVIFPPLFGHQYSHAWIDFRNIQDEYMRNRDITYFENSRRATLANRAYCIENPEGFEGYGENVWGLTASDIPGGYLARGAPPPENDDGTIAPTAAGGSVPFAPEETIAALRHMYDTFKEDLWGPYGFKDAFNLTKDWFASDHIGIDQGAIVLMIENYRSERVWEVFMQNEYVQTGLSAVGFSPVTSVKDGMENIPLDHRLYQNFPNPFNPETSVTYILPSDQTVLIEVYNILGQHIATLVDEYQTAGEYTVQFNARSLPSGIYFYTMESGEFRQTKRMMYVR